MKSITRTAIGLLIIAFGASLLLTNLNILPFSVSIQDWWPLFLIIGGIIMFLSDSKNFLWATLIAGMGVLFQLNQFDIITVNPWQLLWPSIIIVIGLSIMLNRTATKMRVSAHEREDVVAILSGNESHIQSKNYQGSRVSAVLGGAVIDLSKATIKKEATIDLFAFWGGIEIRVPHGVVVKNSTAAILGGVEEQAGLGNEREDAPVLRIIGDVIMAGVEIKRV